MLVGMAVAGVVLGLVAASVALDVPEDELGAHVALRLVDDGLTLVPRGTRASRTLTATRTSGRIELVATGTTRVSQSLDAEPRAIAALELLQRGTLALARAGETTVTSTVPIVRITAATLTPELRGRLVLATLGAGFGVTRDGPAELRLCSARDGASVTIAAEPADVDCTGPRARLADERWAPLVRARLVAARGPVDAVGARSPEPTRDVRRPIVATATPVEPIPVADPLRFTVATSGAAFTRSGGVDPALSLGFSLAGPRFGARADVAGLFASSAPVEVFELLVVAGPTIEVVTHARWSVGAALRAGVLVHRWDVAGSGAGAHVDLTADAAGTLRYALGDAAALTLDVAPGIAARAREHVVDGASSWRRAAPRLSVGLGVAWALGGGPDGA